MARCALIQTLPQDVEPDGKLKRKIELIGNAVPPDLAESVIEGLVTGEGLFTEPPTRNADGVLWRPFDQIVVPPSYTSTTAARRRTMQANRATNTKPEERLRSALFSESLRFNKNYRLKLTKRSINIDIAFPGIKLAVFVDGCFWHGCPTHGHLPKSNQDYWMPKLERNKARDEHIDKQLEDLGWTVVRVWEHEDQATAVARILPIHDQLRFEERHRSLNAP